MPRHNFDPITSTKQCNKCRQRKPVSEFTKNYPDPFAYPDIYSARCKECINIYRRQKRVDNGGGPKPIHFDPTTNTKYCTSCEERKSVSEFYRYSQKHRPRSRFTDIYVHRCKPCTLANTRNRQLVKDFGISLKEYNELRDAHGGMCPVCARNIDLELDHDHATGLIRGFVCRDCNLLIGYIDKQTNPEEYIHRISGYLGLKAR